MLHVLDIVKTLILTLVIILALVAAGVFGKHYCLAHTVPVDDLAKIESGMDWAAVQKILRTDQKPIAQSDGTYFLAIRKHDRWCMVDLWFDSQLRVTSVFHDH